MIGVFRPQRMYQHLESSHAPQVLQAGVLQKERPARKSCAYAALQPLKGFFTPTQYRENAGNLVVAVMCVAK
jgi:hypothetical protein